MSAATACTAAGWLAVVTCSCVCCAVMCICQECFQRKSCRSTLILYMKTSSTGGLKCQASLEQPNAQASLWSRGPRCAALCITAWCYGLQYTTATLASRWFQDVCHTCHFAQAADLIALCFPGKDLCDMSGNTSGRTPEQYTLYNVMLPRKYFPRWQGNLFERRCKAIADQLQVPHCSKAWRAICWAWHLTHHAHLQGGQMEVDYDQVLAKR